MALAKRDEGKKVNSNINVTPMVDVMLVLLIIFMVITPMLNNKVNVDLPKAAAAVVMEDANKEDAVVVAVTRDGKTFLGGDRVNIDDLGTKITAKLENKTNKEVFLRADSRANSTVHGSADSSAGSCRNADGGGITAYRGVSSALHQFRFHLNLTPVGNGHFGKFQPQARNAFHPAGFLRFRNHAANHLSRMSDHVAVRNYRPRESRSERISLLALIA